MEIFQDMLVNALTPITLISGVGLLMLCMTTRYNHATDRIRLLILFREDGVGRNVAVAVRETLLI